MHTKQLDSLLFSQQNAYTFTFSLTGIGLQPMQWLDFVQIRKRDRWILQELPEHAFASAAGCEYECIGLHVGRRRKDHRPLLGIKHKAKDKGESFSEIKNAAQNDDMVSDTPVSAAVTCLLASTASKEHFANIDCKRMIVMHPPVYKRGSDDRPWRLGVESSQYFQHLRVRSYCLNEDTRCLSSTALVFLRA